MSYSEYQYWRAKQQGKRNINVWPLIVSIIILIIIIGSVTFNKLKSQVVITPAAQVNFWDQSIGVMAGYKLAHHTLCFNYQIGHKYEEKGVFYRYDFTNSDAFNLGVSLRAGYINNYFRISLPGLEQSFVFKKCSLDIGIRPSFRGLIVFEPRFTFKLN